LSEVSMLAFCKSFKLQSSFKLCVLLPFSAETWVNSCIHTHTRHTHTHTHTHTHSHNPDAGISRLFPRFCPSGIPWDGPSCGDRWCQVHILLLNC